MTDAESETSGAFHLRHSLPSPGYRTKGERWQFQKSDRLL